MNTDSHGWVADPGSGRAPGDRPRVARPAYGRIAARGLLGATLAVVIGLRVQSHLEERYGLGPESPAARAAWITKRAEEFLRYAEASGTSNPDAAHCATTARTLAKEAIGLDPSLGKAHAIAATASDALGLPDDVVLFHAERAVALDPCLGQAKLVRGRVLVRMYLDRANLLDGGLLLRRRDTSDTKLADLRRKMSESSHGPVVNGVEPWEACLLRRLQDLLLADPTGREKGGVIDWERLAQLLQSTFGRALDRAMSQRGSPRWKSRWRIHNLIDARDHAGTWERDWWYTRWPTYGDRPRAEFVGRGHEDVLRLVPYGVSWRLRDRAGWLGELAADAAGEGMSIVREAQVLEAQGDFDLALKRADKAVALLPDEPGIFMLRARIHEDRLDPTRARADYDEAVRLGGRRAELLRVRAAFLLQTGQVEEALDDARWAAEREGSPLSQALVGDSLVANGRAAEALEILVGSDLSIVRARCRAFRALGQLDGAVADGNRAGDANERALSYLALGQAREAAKCLGLAVNEPHRYREGCAQGAPYIAPRVPPPDNATRLDTCARVMVALGENESAISILDEVLRLQPMRADSRALRAKAFFELGRFVEAGDAAERALSVNPRCAAAWTMHGRLLEADRRPDEAEQAYTKAITLDEHDREARVLLAEIRTRMKR